MNLSTKKNTFQISIANSFSLNSVKSNKDIGKLLKQINFSPVKIVENGGEILLILSINEIKKDKRNVFPTYLTTLPESMSIRYKLSSVDIDGNIFGEIKFRKLLKTD